MESVWERDGQKTAWERGCTTSRMIQRQACSSVRRLGVISGHLRQASSTGRRYDYDLIVVGGGSGGLACSKEAASLGKKVAVLDYVSPSPQGTVWGLGGTCVNVGCIPKKLMHQASLLGQAVEDARSYGWRVPDGITHSWETLTTAVRNHVKSLNWGNRVKLKEKNVDYFNAHGSFVDRHTIEALSKEGNKFLLTSEHFVLAVGGRPKYPENVPGAMEFGISSDDLFSLPKPPGKTLVIGASYVALECAGFLAGLGYPTTLMVRSRCLKAFDKDVVSLVVQNLQNHGVFLLNKCKPQSVSKLENGRLVVTWHSTEDQQNYQDEWDTVLFATGRQAATKSLDLCRAGVETCPTTGKILVNERETTSTGNIHAIGDAMNGRWELTPVAVKSGKLLARRLFGGSQELMDYNSVPTTVFTPLEFASVGVTEEFVANEHKAENVKVYHAFYKPLEYYVPMKDASECYIKASDFFQLREVLQVMIKACRGLDRILGLHLTGPNAGEMMQGFAVAIKSGATREDFEDTIGIHPTCAEEVIKLYITKSSGEDPTVTAC